MAAGGGKKAKKVFVTSSERAAVYLELVDALLQTKQTVSHSLNTSTHHNFLTDHLKSRMRSHKEKGRKGEAVESRC